VWLQVLAAVLLAAFLFSMFRYAMALRASKTARQSWREREEASGRRVLAEIPGADDAMTLFAEDDLGFYWGAARVTKREIAGARLRLNGGILAAWSRAGIALPEPSVPEQFEGRERWDVVLYLDGGATRVVECGTLREGVSREIATRVFQATRPTDRP
jgi:hypothetical protein